MQSRILVFLSAAFLAFAAPAFAQKSAGNVLDDSGIASSVKAGLVAEKGVPSGDVNVEVYKGVVLLSGFVTEQSQKDAAGRVAKGVSGVKQVRNEISIHPKTSLGTKLDDTTLVGKVKAALIDSKDIEANQINVEARGGVVQLGGFVKSTGMRDRAIKVTKGVSGVKTVVDAMFVKPN